MYDAIPNATKNTLSCAVCDASWTAKKKDGLPQRCPRCKSKLWNKCYRHSCVKCFYDWLSASPSPDRCPNCQTKKWRGEDKSSLTVPHTTLSKDAKIPILLRYDAGRGCVNIAIDLSLTFSEVYDTIQETYPDSPVRL